MFKNKHRGFTLAEVLVAMTIVGVVAALTVPALMSDTNAKSNKIRAKKAYATLSSATNSGLALAGYDFGEVTSINGGKPSVSDILTKTLKTSTVTRKADISGNLPLIDANSENCNGNGAYGAETYCHKLILTSITATYKLADGSQLMLLNTAGADTNGCVSNDKAESNPTARPCLALIDINGEKEPNNIIQCTSNQPTTTIWTGVPLATPPETCTIADNAITDIYPVLIYDDRIEPATSAAMTILEEE